MALTLQDLVDGLDENAVWQRLLAKLQGRGLPTIAWASADPISVILQHGLSPMLALLHSYGSSLAQGMLLSFSSRMAERQIDVWNDSPEATFLYWLAADRFAVLPHPPAFALGTVRFTNTTAAPITIPQSYSARSDGGLVFRFLGDGAGNPVTVPPNGTTFGVFTADQAGDAYNVAVNTIRTPISSVAGITISNVPLPPATDWLITYGGVRERPSQVEARCRANWARLSVLQTSPADAYRALALDSAKTGVAGIAKVSVWPHFDPDIPGQAANSIGIFLAGSAGPVTPAQAAAVQAALLPFVGLHDKLKARPCGSAAYAPTGRVKVRGAADIPVVVAALVKEAQALQDALDIGQPVLAFEVRRRIAEIPQVVNFIETLVDFVPQKSALVLVTFAQLVVEV